MTANNTKKLRIQSPSWLGKVAREKYLQICHSLEGLNLDQTQLDLVAMLAEAHETYLQAANELAEHVEATGSLTTTGSNGQPIIHPAFKIQSQCTANYLAIAKQLRISLNKELENGSIPSSEELDNILGI